MRFSYEAFSDDGRTVRGLLEADNGDDAQRALLKRGLTPIQVNAAGDGRIGRQRTGRYKQSAAALAFTELGLLLKGGLSLPDGLAAVSQARRDAVGAGMEAAGGAIRKGDAPGKAFRKAFPRLPDYAHALLEAGARTGALAQACATVGEQLSFDESLRDDVRTALLYPALLMSLGFGAVIFILTFVVPRLSDVFEEAETLPWTSRFVYGTSQLLVTKPLFVGGAAALVGFGIVALLRSKRNRLRLREAASRTPVLGDWIREADAARWTTVMASLLRARSDILEALDLAAAGLVAPRAAAGLKQVRNAVGQGRKLADALDEAAVMPATTVGLIRSGEAAGALPETLGAAAEIHVNAVRRTSKRFLTLVEPAAILFIGGAIGFVAIAVLSAISSISDIPL